jgi:hypothetical protein
MKWPEAWDEPTGCLGGCGGRGGEGVARHQTVCLFITALIHPVWYCTLANIVLMPMPSTEDLVFKSQALVTRFFIFNFFIIKKIDGKHYLSEID